jgi:hypothetical protein
MGSGSRSSRSGAGRILVRDNWEKLTEFEDPVRKAGLA